MAMPLYVITPPRVPRVSYTLDLVLGDLLGIAFHQLLPSETPPEGAPVIAYGVPAPAGALAIPWGGLLGETHIRQDFPIYQPGSPLKLFPHPPYLDYSIDFDLFAAAFYLVSGYERYQARHFDAHDRYDQAAYPSADWNLDRIPLVHRYAALLADLLTTHFPGKIAFSPPAFEAEITIDVDFPWKYQHKGWAAWPGGVMRDLLRLRPSTAAERIRTFASGQDPHDTFALLQSVCPPAQTRFFFLVSGRRTAYDSRFHWTHGPYQALIRELRAAGYGIGLHPSYSTLFDPEQLAREMGGLASILDMPIRHSRQHFLRFRLPYTPRYLLEAGIRDDYSLCNHERGGFPSGMARPFHWFDLPRNQVTTLRLHPAHLMDRTLQAYLQLEPAQAVTRMAQLFDTTRTVGGVFSMIFHNDSLSESGEWEGWRPAILDMLDIMRT